MRSGPCLAFMVLGVLTCGVARGQAVVCVNAAATGADNGGCWADAFVDLQSALDAAEASGGSVKEIWVAGGTYRPSKRTEANDFRSVTFKLIDGVGLYGGFAGTEATREERDPEVYVTVLSGDLAGDDGSEFTNRAENAYHVLRATEVGAGTILDGFEIRSGHANVRYEHHAGGGIRIIRSQPVIRNCRFVDNWAGWQPGGTVAATMWGTNGGGAAFVDFDSDAEFARCEFESNRTNELAGAILSEGTATFYESIFRDNATEYKGGAINHDYGKLLLQQCLFEGNHSNGWAGAVAADAGATVIANECTFRSNTALYAGAVRAAFHTSFQFNSCSFTGNAADLQAGAIYADSRQIEIDNCYFFQNISLGRDGGAVYAEPGVLEIRHSEFLENEAWSGGALAMWYGEQVLIDSSIFATNRAGGGGAISARSQNLSIQHSEFRENAADGGAGAIELYEGVVRIVETEFLRNHGGQAGAIRLEGYKGDIELRTVRFASNVGDRAAGAVWMYGAERLLFEQCEFINNRGAALGGGLRLYSFVGTAEILGCTFSRNRAERGGALAATLTDTLRMQASLFDDNYADVGGGIYLQDAATHIEASRFLGNSALLGGAGVWLQSGDTEIRSTVFSGNRSDGIGGAILFNTGDQGTLALHNSTLAFNRAQGLGGGLLAGPGVSISGVIAWGNEIVTPEPITDEWAQIDVPPLTPVSYSLIQGWTGAYGGVGNSGEDPLFVNPHGMDNYPGNLDDDLHVLPDSPAIDAGDPDFVPGPGETDLDGHPRVLCGRVDIGAYEFGIGDYDCNRVVELTDFAAWEACETGPGDAFAEAACVAFDFNADSDVDLRDFAGWQRVLGGH